MRNMLFLERELKKSRLKSLSGSCLKAKHQHAQVELLLLDVPKVLLDRPHRQSEMIVNKIRLSTLISYLMKIPPIENTIINCVMKPRKMNILLSVKKSHLKYLKI